MNVAVQCVSGQASYLQRSVHHARVPGTDSDLRMAMTTGEPLGALQALASAMLPPEQLLLTKKGFREFCKNTC